MKFKSITFLNNNEFKLYNNTNINRNISQVKVENYEIHYIFIRLKLLTISRGTSGK